MRNLLDYLDILIIVIIMSGYGKIAYTAGEILSLWHVFSETATLETHEAAIITSVIINFARPHLFASCTF